MTALSSAKKNSAYGPVAENSFEWSILSGSQAQNEHLNGRRQTGEGKWNLIAKPFARPEWFGFGSRLVEPDQITQEVLELVESFSR